MGFYDGLSTVIKITGWTECYLCECNVLTLEQGESELVRVQPGGGAAESSRQLKTIASNPDWR